MSSSKKIDLSRDFAASVYLSDTPLPPLNTVCIVHVIIHTGKGVKGGSEPEIRLEGQQLTKLGQKYQHDYKL
jgi:hypothetical protein